MLYVSVTWHSWHFLKQPSPSMETLTPTHAVLQIIKIPTSVVTGNNTTGRSTIPIVKIATRLKASKKPALVSKQFVIITNHDYQLDQTIFYPFIKYLINERLTNRLIWCKHFFCSGQWLTLSFDIRWIEWQWEKLQWYLLKLTLLSLKSINKI